MLARVYLLFSSRTLTWCALGLECMDASTQVLLHAIFVRPFQRLEVNILFITRTSRESGEQVSRERCTSQSMTMPGVLTWPPNLSRPTCSRPPQHYKCTSAQCRAGVSVLGSTRNNEEIRLRRFRLGPSGCCAVCSNHRLARNRARSIFFGNNIQACVHETSCSSVQCKDNNIIPKLESRFLCRSRGGPAWGLPQKSIEALCLFVDVAVAGKPHKECGEQRSRNECKGRGQALSSYRSRSIFTFV